MCCMGLYRKILRFYQREGIIGMSSFLIKKVLSYLSSYRWFLRIFIKYLDIHVTDELKLGLHVQEIKLDFSTEFYDCVANDLWCVLGSGFVPLSIWREKYDTSLLNLKFDREKYAGKDIKDVWDLARCQYLLPQYLVWDSRGDNNKIAQLIEDLNIFCERNTFDYTPLSNCTMEVSIRAVNICIVYHRIKFKYSISSNLIESFLKESFVFILMNLEYHNTHRSNHYLSNIMALVVLGEHFKGNSRFSGLMAKVNHVGFDEIIRQFNSDGGNFESSSAYHFLSLEMACLMFEFGRIKNELRYHPFGTNIIFPQHLHDIKWLLGEVPLRLRLAIDYAEQLRKPNGKIWKYGDNDSGYIFAWNHITFKIEEELYIDDRFKKSAFIYLDYFKNRYFSADKLLDRTGIGSIETNVVDRNYLDKVYETKYDSVELNFRNGRLYSESGTYIYNHGNVFLAINVTPDGQNGLGGHSHMDTGSYELTTGCVDLAVDPGSLTYTGNVKLRELYRSPVVHGLPNEFSEFFQIPDLFSSRNRFIVDFKLASESRIEVRLTSGDFLFTRVWELIDNSLIVSDFSNSKCTYSENTFVEQITYGIN